MPHYKDGTPAKVGDVVRGKGYNVKGPDGKLAEIIGQVLSVTPGAENCNIQLAYFKSKVLPADFRYPDYELFSTNRGILIVGHDGNWFSVQADIEYGQADQFEKIA